MKPIVILGGTGFVGRALCEQLVAEHGGGDPRLVVPTRRRARARHLAPLPSVDIVEADVHDDAALARLLRGAGAVVNLVAMLHGTPQAFEHAHVTLPRRLAQACMSAGVRRLVHVSALGVPEDPAEAPSHYLRTKALGEQALRQAARQADGGGPSALALTILRPSVIFGAHDRFLNLFARLQALLPVVPLAGADARFQPVWVDDVAAAVRRCLRDPRTAGQIYECAGPEVLTLAELVRLAGAASGHRRPIVPLPAGAGRLQAALMRLWPGEPLMSADNLDSMRVPNVAGGHLPGLPALGISPASVHLVAPAWLAPGPDQAAWLERWRRRASSR